MRSKFAKYIDLDDINGLDIRIKTAWLFVEILTQIKLYRDPKDDKFIDLALNGDASHLNYWRQRSAGIASNPKYLSCKSTYFLE
jgi:predicted nucleic acid-binding protein